MSVVQVIEDLVAGELQQLGGMGTLAASGVDAAFSHCISKTYRKTASLMANSVKAVISFLFTRVCS